MLENIDAFLVEYNYAILAVFVVALIVWIFTLVDYDLMEDEDDFLKPIK